MLGILIAALKCVPTALIEYRFHGTIHSHRRGEGEPSKYTFLPPIIHALFISKTLISEKLSPPQMCTEREYENRERDNANQSQLQHLRDITESQSASFDFQHRRKYERKKAFL